jgi:hypothetical protein
MNAAAVNDFRKLALTGCTRVRDIGPDLLVPSMQGNKAP